MTVGVSAQRGPRAIADTRETVRAHASARWTSTSMTPDDPAAAPRTAGARSVVRAWVAVAMIPVAFGVAMVLRLDSVDLADGFGGAA